MKQNFRRIIALLLTVTVIIGCTAVGASALYADENWKTYYAEYMDKGYAVLMNPGSDETERNFSWYTPLAAGVCRVYVSESRDFANAKSFTGSFVVTPEGDRANKITVKGLEKGKTYYYRCCVGETVIKEATFRTVADKSFNAIYVTDIHVSRKQDGMDSPLVNQSYTVDAVMKQAKQKADIDLLISAGDQASYGDRREYMSLFASPEFSSVPFALAPGNHDRKGIAYKYFNNNPNKFKLGISSLIGNDYWYVKGDVLFMVFDSNCTAAVSHRNFAKAAVEANPDVKWRVAVMHHDLYGRVTGRRLEDANENRRPVFVPIFDEFGVDLVLLGHSHFYTVSNALYDGKVAQKLGENNSITDAKGTIYMVSGSINRPRGIADAEKNPATEANAIALQKDGMVYNIVTFSSDSIRINTYNYDDGELFNTVTISKTSQAGGHPEYDGSPNIKPNRLWLEFLSFWTEFGEGIAGIWKNYFDR